MAPDCKKRRTGDRGRQVPRVACTNICLDTNYFGFYFDPATTDAGLKRSIGWCSVVGEGRGG